MNKQEDIQCKIIIQKDVINNTVHGEVHIISKEELIIQHAIIEISGIASCRWNLDKVHIKFPKIYTKNTIVKGIEEFYFTRHTLCGGDISHKHKNQELYPFDCFWPTRLPGTWVGEHGFIKYTGKVIIKLLENMYTHSEEIIVTLKRDLSLEKHLLFEGRLDVRRNFFATSHLGHVDVSVWIPICGIAAGQSLPVLCTVYNNSEVHFGGLLFVLTRIDIYRAKKPVSAVKTVRTDICRIARMVNIHKGKYEYYSILQTNKDTLPTNQFYNCTVCQIIYEVWVSIQGAFPRYRTYGYPNIDTPGIPVIIGTDALLHYDPNEITANVFKKLFEFHPPIIMDELPEDEEVKELINAREEFDVDIASNLNKQLGTKEKF